jgi:DNA polymerase-4
LKHPALAGLARELLAGLGRQRARGRAIALRAERLRPAEHGAHQLTLDPHNGKLHRLETVLDRARARYGPHIAGAASAYRQAG